MFAETPRTWFSLDQAAVSVRESACREILGYEPEEMIGSYFGSS